MENALTVMAEADSEVFLQFKKPSLTSQELHILKQVWKETYRFTHLLAPVSMTAFHQLLNAQLSRKQWAALSTLNAIPRKTKGPQLIRWSPMQGQGLARQIKVEQLCA